VGCLKLLDSGENFFRQVRWAVLPLMVWHTALWIGINSSPERGTDRLGNLLKYYPNQALHYQYFTLGHYYLNIRRDDDRQAARFFREALSHTPAEATDAIKRYRDYLSKSLVALGLEHFNRDQYEQAAAAYQEAIQLDNSPKAHYNLGLLFDKQGQYEQAIRAYREAIRVKPDSPKAYYNLGLLYQKQGLYQQAAEAYRQAIRFGPDSPRAYNNLGVVYLIQGRYERAAQVYREAVQLAPDDPDLRFNLGMSYLSLGEKESAYEQYEILRRLDPELAARLLRRL